MNAKVIIALLLVAMVMVQVSTATESVAQASVIEGARCHCPSAPNCKLCSDCNCNCVIPEAMLLRPSPVN